MENPRDIERSQYPKNGSIEEKSLFLINYAVLAPSSHNTQPWIFEIDNDTIYLYSDTKRALPVVDPINRELVISCGAALGHLQVAANFFGLSCNTIHFPDQDDSNLLAKIQLHEDHVTTSNEIHLFLAIKERYTSREPFLTSSLPSSLASELMSEAKRMAVELHLITDSDQKSAIAKMVSNGDREQFADPDFREELSNWIRPRHNKHHDGMSSSAAGAPDILSKMNALIIRTFDVGDGVSATHEAIAENSPMLAVISTSSDNPKDWLLTGEFLSNFLLRATGFGVNAGYLNQVTEVDELREALCQLLAVAGQPQLLLRIGKAKPIKPSTRRPIASVLRTNKQPGHQPQS